MGLTGDTTRDYTDRMSDRLDELGEFFGGKGIDINDPVLMQNKYWLTNKEQQLKI